MATKYLLPCSCGKAARVDTHQAGDTTVCVCGKTLVVPSMRELRELQPAPAEDAAGKPTAQWSKREGLVFAVGLLVLLTGLCVAGYFQIGRLGLDTRETRYDNLEDSLQQIDSMNVSELWDAWSGVLEFGIGPYSPPSFVVNRHVSSKWLLIIWGGLGFACLGILICLTAFFMRQPAK
jgi:hypothetical protein